MINIIAHRGYWFDSAEKNTLTAFSRALENGFGIETDLRDLNGDLVISHDVPTIGAISASQLIALYQKYPISAHIALNIKSDGLHNLVHQFIADAMFQNVFVFDMAVPDMRDYLKNQIPTFTRFSEYETQPALLTDCKGVWLDAFESEWYGIDEIIFLLKQNKAVAIVSPELHGRQHLALWELIRAHELHHNDLVSICTDFPMQAKEYFDE